MRRTLAPLMLAALACGRDVETFDLTPTSGRKRGGDPVRLEGRDFSTHGAPVVYFGAKSAHAVVIESDRLITVRTPELLDGGEVEVKLVFPDGTERLATAPYAFDKGDVIDFAALPES